MFGWRRAVLGQNRLAWGVALGELGGCGAQPWRSSGVLRESEGLERLLVLWCGKAKRFGFQETPQLV